VLRALLGCLAVLAAAAATSAVFISGEVSTLVSDLNQNGSLKVAPGSLAGASFGGPQTLLLVGDDQRKLTKYYHHAVLPHSNEMLLVRLDPNKPWISMLSIPRDLQVMIDTPGGRVQTRFNYAYTAGGIPLLLSTIKRVIGLQVNHVVVITFARFKRAVDQMGCVYSTIDRRYYHANVPGSEQYQEIDLQPGYQKVCGDQALQFVSYRHGDNALIRDSRDQSFLLDVKKQFGPTLSNSVHKFERIFGQAVQTDPVLHTTTGIEDLLGTLISSSGRRVRKVTFQANLGVNAVTASQQQIAASVHSFLYGGSAVPKKSTAAVANAVHRGKGAPKLPLVPTSGAEIRDARRLASNFTFPVEYPRVRDQPGSGNPVFLRNYLVHAPDGTAYAAYVGVFAGPGLDQYYDVQGMKWTNAPQFDSPEQTVHVGGRTYSLYYEGENLKVVAWFERGAVYWIRNTLLNQLSNGELMAIAEQTVPVGIPNRGAGRPHVSLNAVGVPGAPTRVATTDTKQTVAAAGGLLTLLAVPLLAFLLFRRRQQLIELRQRLQAHLQWEAQLATVTSSRFANVRLPPSASGFSATNVYRASGTRAREIVLPIAIVAVLAGAGIGGYVLISSNSGSTAANAPAHPGGAPVGRVARPSPPAAPVAVLNASGTQGVAHTLAGQLRTLGVKVTTVGNVTATRPPGVQIFYVPGAKAQADALARLIASRSPSVLPIDAVTQAAAGGGVPLVVVIS
jgi:LCP family protein required for cell wall assembly